MKRLAYFCGIALVLSGFVSCDSKQNPPVTGINTINLPALQPDSTDIGKGVSAAFAGVQGDYIIVAGGCNFPDKPAKDGGAKVFYDAVFVGKMLPDNSKIKWKEVGRLPDSLAYGASIQTRNGLICIGGNNQKRSSKRVFRLLYDPVNDKILTDTLPDLPFTMDNVAGAMINDVIYAIGGNLDKKPTNRMYALDLNATQKRWYEKASFPGYPRIQSVAVAQQAGRKPAIFLFGGFSLPTAMVAPTLSLESFAYFPDNNKWIPIPTPVDDEGNLVSLGGGIGGRTPDGNIICFGGVNKDIFLDALYRDYQIQKEMKSGDQTILRLLRKDKDFYMSQKPSYFQFNNHALLYKIKEQKWVTLSADDKFALAGAVAAFNDERLIIINGEIMPGVRTPQILEVTYKH